MNTLHGELYLDEDGKAHFICHTPGKMGYHEAKAGLIKFIAVLQDTVDRERECPHYRSNK